ncbi:MAG: flagellar biosynthesis protein FlhF [Chromatiales bacterium 21-64-14]|nr:MAG: flagellar biosynthesis protein FlhF [Chromatiales bacterium 21-64-14]HQU15071.1 flagellar biosynthesis protein FlhF [Gammaproteobacteria bacterium]
MKIKRYFAADMRQAIRQVRDEQGPEAVILSNRQVKGGVEVIAAVDYDETLLDQTVARSMGGGLPTDGEPAGDAGYGAGSKAEPGQDAPGERAHATSPATNIWSQEPTLVEMQRELRFLRDLLEDQLSSLAWGELARRQPVRARLLKRLGELGFGPALAQDLAREVAEGMDFRHAWRHALEVLCRRVPVLGDDILTKGGTIALVGPTGVGKTTMVAKLAAHFVLRHGQRHVALVTTDSYRIGAQEQLRAYGRILGAPVYAAADENELHGILDELRDRRLVLVDTAGMSQRDVRLSEQFTTLHGGDPRIQTYLVLSATAQRAVLDEVVRAFRGVPLTGGILTKVDETTSLGDALSAAVQHRLPLAYVGDGQRVPEDLHPARAAVLVARCAKLMENAAPQVEPQDLVYATEGMAANAHV